MVLRGKEFLEILACSKKFGPLDANFADSLRGEGAVGTLVFNESP